MDISCLKFDVSVMDLLDFCQMFSLESEFIPRKVFVVSLFAMPNTECNTYLIANGTTQYEILEKTFSYLKNTTNSFPSSLFSLSSNSFSYLLDYSIYELFETAMEIAHKSYRRSLITIPDLVVAFAEKYEHEYNQLMALFIPDDENRFTTTPICQRPISIPDNLQFCLTNLNSQYSANETECKICGRDSEVRELTKTLLKTTKRNAVLVGEPGVGKTAIAELLTWNIVTGNCPDELKYCTVVSLDVTSIIAGTQYRGTAEERFKMLISFLEENPRCILFIDEIHLLLGAGATEHGQIDLANALKPILARGTCRVIGATTEQEYQKYFSLDGALKRRFEKIFVREPLFSEVYPMIKNQVKTLEKVNGITISKSIVQFATYMSACFNFTTRNPDRTLDLLDKTFVSAKLDGKKTVSKKHVLDNFAIRKSQFKKLSTIAKMATAYHEAGHYILRRYAPELSMYKTLAISIMPAEDYLGINVYEEVPDVIPSQTREFYIQLIASILAGRISEYQYTFEYSSGADSDLFKATTIAHDMITKYGLGRKKLKFRSFPEDMNSTENLKAQIDEEIDIILSESQSYAEKVLKDHSESLKIVVDALIERGILFESEINKILQS